MSNLLDWLERLFDKREFHRNEWFTLFAGDERYIEINFTETEVWVGAITNHNLSPAEWLSESDETLLHELRWWCEEVGSPEPQYVRRWPVAAPTKEIVGQVMRVLTSVYLRPNDDEVEVLRGVFLEDEADADADSDTGF